MYRLLTISSLVLLTVSFGFAQQEDEGIIDYDSVLNAYLTFDSLLLDQIESDSMTIFDLIDSLMLTDLKFSALSARGGYTSSILNAGRDLGVSQYGFSAGLSYYHKSGFFGDALAYWNSEAVPNHYLDVLTVGYLGTITQNWSIMASYDLYNYRKGSDETDVYYPFSQALNLSSYIDLKFLSAGVDYSFLFGKETGHRIRPNILAVIRTGEWGFIDRMTFLPGAGLLLGNSTIITTSLNQQRLFKAIRQAGGPERFKRIYARNKEIIDLWIYQDQIESVFGLMNYALVAPVYVYIGNFTITASYSINFPVALPGEDLDTRPNSFFGSSVIFNIPFK